MDFFFEKRVFSGPCNFWRDKFHEYTVESAFKRNKNLKEKEIFIFSISISISFDICFVFLEEQGFEFPRKVVRPGLSSPRPIASKGMKN
jgi:hypothetical protein